MNKQGMAEYIVAIFQNCEAYYKEHLADFGSVLPHVFASEAINGPMKAEFEVNAQSEIFNKYCRLIQHLWKSGDEEVRNAVDVTILESISDNSLMWEAFGENNSFEFKKYINDELLTKNIAMSHVDRLKGKTEEVDSYSEKEIQIVKSGTDAVRSAYPVLEAHFGEVSCPFQSHMNSSAISTSELIWILKNMMKWIY